MPLQLASKAPAGMANPAMVVMNSKWVMLESNMGFACYGVNNKGQPSMLRARSSRAGKALRAVQAVSALPVDRPRGLR